MKLPVISLLLAVAGASFLPSASATVLTFDDLGADGVVPMNYGGLDWSASSWFAFGAPQQPYTAHSGDYRVAADFEAADSSTTISFGTPASFQGAWFAGLQGATVTFQLYLAGALVATSATLDPGETPQFLASGYSGLVDKLVVASPSQGSYVMDDFSFTAAVPEPQTYALLLAGLCALSIAARRRANQ